MQGCHDLLTRNGQKLKNNRFWDLYEYTESNIIQLQLYNLLCTLELTVFGWGKHEKQKDEYRHYGDNFTCESGMYPVALFSSKHDDDYNDEAV